MSEDRNSLRTILLEALEIEDPQKRAAYLSQACGTDSALRREVEELIQAHAAASQFLPEQPALTGVRAALLNSAEALGPHGPVSNVPLTERPGDRIGRYKLLQEIGEGGCGVVYMAEQEEPVRRKVALKVIKLGMDTKQVVARFEAERQALALMDHPHIARVFDAGATEAGRPFFVMELVRGNKITEYCDENELSTRERLELFIQVCLAVQHAHQKGIIHRDLKPSNILVTVNDANPVPKVIDFGIAKATEGRLRDHTLFTAFDQFLGTPAYMSPEQTVLTTQDIDTRSDIYSLGVLLYELLTGKTPFDTKELLASGLDELRRTIREKEPMRPSTRLKSMLQKELTTAAKHRKLEAPKLIQLLRGDLDSIVGKCLEKDRAHRYETANGLAADLQRHLNNEPIIARPASTIYRLGKVAQRNKLAFTAGIAIVAVLLVGTAVSTWQAVRIERERQKLHRRVVKEYVAKGTGLVNDGDLFGSLLWYAEALRLDAGDPRREEPHRIRIASVLRQCPKLLNVFSHGEMLYHAEFSKAGDCLVTSSDDHTARVWDAETGAPLLVLRHDGEVYDAAFNSDGSRIVTSSQDKTARIWDSRTGALLWSLEHRDRVWRSRFSPDGRLVATGCEDHTAQLWDAATGERVGEPLRHESRVAQVAFSPDGRLLGVTTGADTAHIWDVVTRQRRFQFAYTGCCGGIEVAFSPDSQRFLTCDGSNLRVWDAQTLKEVSFSPLKHTENINDLSFSPDGRAIVAAGLDFTARVWSADTGRPLFSPGVSHAGAINSPRIGPDGRRFATGGNDAMARVWSTGTGQPVGPPLKVISVVKYVAFNADGRRLLANGCDQAARVWDMATSDLPGPSRPIFENEHRIVSPDGHYLLQLGESNIVWIADAQTDQNLAALPHANAVGYASFSRDGRTVITVCAEQNAVSSMWSDIFLWEAPTGRRLNADDSMAHKSALVSYAAFSPDNTRLLTCGVALLWDAHTGQALGAELQHVGRVTWGAFSPDGQSVVTASWDKTARVWDSATGAPLTPPLKHKAIVVGAFWSVDGRRLHTVTEDDHLQVWDLDNGNGEPLTPPRKIQDRTVASRTLASAHPSEDLLPDKRPVADLVLLSQMLAEGRIDAGGNVVPLKLPELTSATHYLREKWPKQFAATPSEAVAWHRREAEDSEAETNLTAASFHIDRALERRPRDQDLLQMRVEVADAVASSNAPAFQLKHSRRISARDPAASAQQIDLSAHYNCGLQESLSGNPDGNDLAELPVGLHTFAGVRFDIRGVVQLYGLGNSIKDIRIARKCRSLHFLQAVAGAKTGTQVGSYVLHYADGQQQVFPIVCGQDSAEWWFLGLPAEMKGPGHALVAWDGDNRCARKRDYSICLWKSTRENPRPDVELESIDFVSSTSEASPFLVALTVE